ncbi:c-type cytochrome [Flavobacterium sp. 7A]|uniref:c-type cytochrome n=1 Tax=Flavobacterium sp. 7A TaxID=2940571 RepID=UPI002226824D|nr:c-type cytochrome [Flavobacterium sp. 7A]MCW2120901.1 thiosulfate dehydrogenase [Flavobacterium sp. 7A]
MLKNSDWLVPDTAGIPNNKLGIQIKYGRELIVSTSKYIGPNGKISADANGMNCQNCHNAAGTKAYGLNYSAVEANYPQYKARSNSIVTIADRVNGCFERSMNGKKLDTTSHEMRAIVSYMKWLGKSIPKKTKPVGTGVEKLAFLDRAAEPVKGKVVYSNLCISCHGNNGEGRLNEKKDSYTYPPLWGKHSYNDGAGLYRLSNFSGFVKNNMPYGVTYQHPTLSDEDSWDVAAYVNSQPRPHKEQSKDWKDITQKPFDFPFGPYADQFSEAQHKYGPYKPLTKKTTI